MMDHDDYKRLLLTDPAHPTPDMLAHLAGCPDCAAHTDRVLHFEDRLARALRVTVAPSERGAPWNEPSVSAAAPVSAVRRRRWRGGLALAASVLVAVVLVGGLWLGSTGRSLAADVVSHMAEEPGAWASTDVAVPAPALERVMAGSNLRLKPGAGLVSYANSCGFRGHQVPHLVVQTAAGPVTVMVLTHESVAAAVHFDEQGYRGTIIPVAGHGSLAVLEHDGHGDPAVLQQVAAGVLAAIEWSR